MGYYINPSDMTKEEWLMKHGGKPFVIPPEKHLTSDNRVAICLVDNVGFTAAGIAYDTRELSDFARDDGRRKIWFLVPLEALKEVMGNRMPQVEGVSNANV